MIARNFTMPGIKGELDVAACDGPPVLASVEVKTPAKAEVGQPTPEDAINQEKRRNLARMARQFLRARGLENTPWRFDVLAIETTVGQKLVVRLHKSACSEHKS
jgi:putative endonuclease